MNSKWTKDTPSNTYALIDKVWKNPRTGFGGAQSLYEQLRNEGITMKQVKEYLSQQNEYNVHIDQKIPHKKEEYNKIRSDKFLGSVQMDLLDLQRYASKNKGYNYILSLQDVYSRKTWLYPLKTKSPEEIEPFLQHFITKVGKPQNITADFGSEFLGKVKELIENKGIRFYQSLVKNRLGIINRQFRNIRKIIKKIPQFKWQENLTDIEENLNNAWHRTIAAKPKDDDPIGSSKNPQVVLKFDIGDVVKIKEERKTFAHHHAARWSNESYLVYEVEGQAYKLIDMETEEIVNESYTSDQLRKISSNPMKLIEIIQKLKVGADEIQNKEGKEEIKKEPLVSDNNAAIEVNIADEIRKKRTNKKEGLDIHNIIQAKRNEKRKRTNPKTFYP